MVHAFSGMLLSSLGTDTLLAIRMHVAELMASWQLLSAATIIRKPHTMNMQQSYDMVVWSHHPRDFVIVSRRVIDGQSQSLPGSAGEASPGLRKDVASIAECVGS